VAKFCGECGTPLNGAPGAAQPAPPEAAPPPGALDIPAGERRQVTVLFADLCGFTQLSSELDAEETHDLLNRFFAEVDAVVEACGGSIDKHIGDAAMAVFGAPISHGDDPMRATRAALDIQAAMPRLGEEAGRALKVHIGLAAGEVVARGTGSDRHSEYTVTGDTVNLASRLQDLAEPGETLISNAVYEALGAAVRASPLDEVTVKGIDHAVQVWRLEGVGSGHERSVLGPCVGRDAEMA